MLCETSSSEADFILSSGRSTLAPESGISGLDRLVDEVDVEVEGEASGDGDPLVHAGRKGADRHVEIAAEFHELLDPRRHFLDVHAVQPRKERDVLARRDLVMEGARESDGKGYPAFAHDTATVRHFRSGCQAQQGRLASSIRAEDADPAARLHAEVHVVEDDVPCAAHQIALAHALEADHTAFIFLRNARSSMRPT